INATKCLLNNPNIAINQQTKTEGWTALLMAIGHRNTLILKLLFDANADPELANNDGLTPLQFAEQIKNQEIIDLIRDAIDKKHGKK
ncbi:MAG TPA: ankyrin repeat domain-containing protein, partial [Candidatus Babeliales bacterium]|nr:ankyrin repeat domain-containing protein [Candidatus Babeliales bacterium]